MFIATETGEARTPSGVPCAAYGCLHFTPDAASRNSDLVTLNIALLAEGVYRISVNRINVNSGGDHTR